MKHKLVALVLSIVLATGSVGAVPVFAAGTTAQEAAPDEEDNVEVQEKAAEISEDADADVIADEVFGDEYAETVEKEIGQEPVESIVESVSPEEQNVEEPVLEEETVTYEENEAVGDIVASGTCGDDLTWMLETNGVLTISGTGDMEDYTLIELTEDSSSYTSSAPWAVYNSEINSVIVGSGVTRVGNAAFYNCYNTSSIKLSDTLVSIGMDAFRLTHITTIQIPSSVCELGMRVLEGCYWLEEVKIPYKISVVPNYCCANCSSLATVWIYSKETQIPDDAFSGCDGFSILGYAGGCTETYAKENGIPFVMLCVCTGEPHELGDTWIVEKPATCIREGIKEKKCSDCSYTITEVIPLKEHTWNKIYKIDRAPTCVEEGSESIHCIVCGEIKAGTERTIGIEKLSHTYGDWETVKESTCAEPGSRKKTCSGCGDEVFEEIPRKDHIWNKGYTVDKEPTYTEAGVKSIHCSVCNAVRKGTDILIPKLYKELSGLLITGIVNKTYTGKTITQDLVIRDGSKKLVQNIDYTISYRNNIDVGTASANIYGIGSYKGTVTTIFMILPGKTARGDMFNLANSVKVTWQEVPGAQYYKVYREDLTDYRESLSKPVIVTKGLIGWDYEEGLVNGHAYRYKIVASVTGKDDPSGDSPLSYSKIMYRLKTVAIRSVKNTSPGKVTVKYDKTATGDSYVLRYCEREDMVGAKTKVVQGANNESCVIGGLKKGKTYYISIRVRKKVNGINYYTTFGVPKKIKIVK